MTRYRLNNKFFKKVDRCPQYYAIESLEIKYLYYIWHDNEFAIARNLDSIRCEISEVPELAEYFIPSVKQEILDIYEDLKSLNTMQLSLEKKYEQKENNKGVHIC